MHSVWETDSDGSCRSGEDRNQKQRDKSNSIALQEFPIALVGDGRRIAIPVNTPKQKNENADGGADVLQDRVPGAPTEERKGNLTAQNGQVIAEPISCVSK